jgi:hypothetical protein
VIFVAMFGPDPTFDGVTSRPRRSGEHRGNVRLRAALPEVLQAWTELTREAPWHVQPDRFGVDAVNEVLRAILDVGMASASDHDAHERLVRAAIAHGDQRRAQRAGDDALLREYQALREAIWRFLERSKASPDESLPAIMRIDVAISVATTASMRGYHRADSEPASSWEPRLLRYIRDASERISGGLDAARDQSADAP